MTRCEICGKSAGTRHHYYDRAYLKKMGIGEKTSLWRHFRGRKFQHAICNKCHQTMNAKQESCRKSCKVCGKCEFHLICCHTLHIGGAVRKPS